MKNRRISITSSIIEGIETMINAGFTNENCCQYILSWIQNIQRFPLQRYADLPTDLLEKLNILKNNYIENKIEKDGLVYHKSILDAFTFIEKMNERQSENYKLVQAAVAPKNYVGME